MHFVSPIFDLYSDYLLVNQGQTTATGLSALVEGKLSHDAITRSLHQLTYGSAQLWQVVKPFVQQIADPNAVLTLDDTVEHKPYMDQNPLIRFHYDHCQRVALKGINQLTALYTGQTSSLPVAYALIEKDLLITDNKTGKTKWISRVSKQERFRQLIRQSLSNNLIFKYILADCWFSSADNFTYIAGLEQQFIMPLKNNRKVALSQADQQQGRYQPIESLGIEEHQCLAVWVTDVDFPLLLTKQVFKDGDREQGILYLVTNDLTADPVSIQTQYARRWKVEEFHKSIKSNTGYSRSPAHTVRSQSNHLFLSMLAFVKLEALRLATSKNHFALKSLLTMNAMKLAMRDLNSLKSQSTLLAKAA
ncbi:IS701 family transposase [Larkinella punicea]|uniref:IS701 family transposase n=2 Tax=Larkinella punicea TaxID=2315727 RepID=A0A368JH50_9BACT|nr:IS701 family transposase [Larkinella punicea]